MNIPFRNLYLEIIPTKLGKMGNFREGKGPKFDHRMDLKKITGCTSTSVPKTNLKAFLNLKKASLMHIICR
jgi:hypothetical protein